MTAVPRRLPVLGAKGAVFTAVVFTVSFATALITFLTAQLFFSGTDQAASLTDDGVLTAIGATPPVSPSSASSPSASAPRCDPSPAVSAPSSAV